MAATRVRDTRSGKFAKRGEAKRRPATTVTERVSKRERLLEQLVFDLHVQLETAVTLLQRMRALSMETSVRADVRGPEHQRGHREAAEGCAKVNRQQRRAAGLGCSAPPTAQDCPCCHDDPEDRALVVAFLAGISASEMKVPLGEALCPKHARLAAEAVAFVNGFLGRSPS